MLVIERIHATSEVTCLVARRHIGVQLRVRFDGFVYCYRLFQEIWSG